MNAKQKGARGERLWRDELNANGFTGSMRDGQQGGGVNGSGYHPDTVCPTLPYLHSEVKFTQNLNVRQALNQAINDCNGNVPIVAWKKNNCPWTVTMLANDWFNLVNSGSIYLKEKNKL